ncbi:hypothetical protein PIB30_088983 [Stylosanthes scabra]|uniref:argininosuccinate synthase n=1 Tax=Stylosanthes scabra TaxID=79078 RepID=A0ABU6VU11_9FABA|nr:hypothetical protein [Stylosanthes scabra]
MMSVYPEDAPNQPEYVKIGIESGLPISVNGKQLSPTTFLAELNEIGGSMELAKLTWFRIDLWFDPLRESMDAFMQKITETTIGSVTLKLYKGSATVASRKSPYSLYRQDISSFESGKIYDQADAAVFIRLYGLLMRVRAMLEQGI